MLDTNFLVATVLVVIALLFYILYWNRLLAFFVGLLLRVVLWNRGGSSTWFQIGIYISLSCLFHPSYTQFIGSLHFSLLAGRILLKDFHYHSSNQTIKVVKVQLRWQYWIRSLTTSENMQPHTGGEEPKSDHPSVRHIVASTRQSKASSGSFTIERLHSTISSPKWKQRHLFLNVVHIAPLRMARPFS
ncbi:hypothetical protein B0F90DRAFT_370982 [Multifurca ochricompacta]|uniref:Uncharacterized protein n=1 Tax=Multifurca ochricompacta TaxID=376703 RepID=A0AAD4M3L9_9AGAM|nr:hypothetical protein B0F90DRAFT_370982 [Multifurca ochricompacta]